MAMHRRIFAVWGTVILVWTVLGLAACQRDIAGELSESAVLLHLEPRSSPAITDLCYTVVAADERGREHWRETSMCASEFGAAAGELDVAGACDGAGGAVELTIEIDAAYVGSRRLPSGEFVNPCPSGSSRCRVRTQCQPGNIVELAYAPVVARVDAHAGAQRELRLDGIACRVRAQALEGGLESSVSNQWSSAWYVGLDCDLRECRELSVYAEPIEVECEPRDSGMRRRWTFAAFETPQTDEFEDDSRSSRPTLVHRADRAEEHGGFGVVVAVDGERFSNCELRTRATWGRTPLAVNAVGFTTPIDAIYPHVEWTFHAHEAQLELGQANSSTGPSSFAHRRQFACQE